MKDKAIKRRSMLQESMIRLFRNKTAMMGLLIFAIIVLSCLFANFIKSISAPCC